MLSDIHEAAFQDRRNLIEDQHTAKTYELYRERSKAINSLLSLGVVFGTILTCIAAGMGIAVIIWAWRVVL